jgi:1-deoxy-D-xylulose-5-phosphate reductoisomerase
MHPQSVVHSMVEMLDGSIIAQLGVTDMKHAIQLRTHLSRSTVRTACHRSIFRSSAN